VPGGSASPGERIELPESWACRAVASGAAEFTDIVSKLTDKAMRYLEQLKRDPTRPPPYEESVFGPHSTCAGR
jgi:hypothetical protein